jgi:hypothetical protein
LAVGRLSAVAQRATSAFAQDGRQIDARGAQRGTQADEHRERRASLRTASLNSSI